MVASTTPMATPLSLLNRGDGVGRIADSRTAGWSRLQSWHAEEAKEKGHQRCYHYSLHLDYLAFLSRYEPDSSNYQPSNWSGHSCIDPAQ